MSLRRPVLGLLLSRNNTICIRCARRLAQAAQKQDSTRGFHVGAKRRQSAVAAKGGSGNGSGSGSGSEGVDKTFFWANAFRRSHREQQRGEEAEVFAGKSHGAIAGMDGIVDGGGGGGERIQDVMAPTATEEPPHRRRKRLKAEAAAAAQAAASQQAVKEVQLPPDASSTLSQTAAAAPAKSWRRIVSIYLALSKPRLAFLIVLTTTASYSIYPVPDLLSATATTAPSLSTLTLLYLTTGTFLAIASANTLNMLFEPAYDAKMSRTRNRPLVRGLVSKRSALLFAIATGVLGTILLWEGVNPTTAILGASNIALYAFAYTPLKRIHPINTWVGAVVGAIPPLMGWCAAASQYSTTNASIGDLGSLGREARELLFTEQAVGGWLIAALLFAWQFPHFFALSHGVRHEYASAGYRMLTSTNIPMAARVTDPGFVVTSSVINGWMLREAWRMWWLNAERGSARALFWASVWQLPIVLVLAMVQKKGLGGDLWRGIMGGDEEEEEEWEDQG
ncbi:Protoheme IX farnesyltransferase, mitochondrial [Recurvomyces mirabilis]|uniref:Protoheme IX farnesyltransferase, mitochondrial n=1 Tax=Recurvomyces mirabilis TaxID=574656 RepID=UPI002DDEFB97|nr:Protoheme IX farnesyltransferase, mitochondrial [Recurvomyces mirabilis]